MVVFKFHADIWGTVAASDGALPIYDESGLLIGGFTVYWGDLVVGFLSGRKHPLALEISLGEDVWFTPLQEKSGLVGSAIVSPRPINATSCRIHPQKQEVK